MGHRLTAAATKGINKRFGFFKGAVYIKKWEGGRGLMEIEREKGDRVSE